MKNILKYLKRTKNLFLIFRRDSELRVEGYTDSNFIFDPDDEKSMSGYAFAMVVQLAKKVSSNPS